MHDIAVGALIIGGVLLIVGLFGLVPASDEMREAGRRSFQRDEATPGYLRYARQRRFVLDRIARPLRWVGALLLLGGLVGLAAS